jgi:hypothetical protein
MGGVMPRRCASPWCNALADDGQPWCSWCWQHRGCYADGTPRDPRHPWYSGNPDLHSKTPARVPELCPADEEKKRP